jgi:hypothetical protein
MTVRKSDAVDADAVVPPVDIVTETTFPPGEVPDPITILKLVDVPPARLQLPVVPPTVTLQLADASCTVVMKLVPVTVMVLPM